MPNIRCGVELVEFANVDRKAVHRRYQDPGAVTLILIVRDIDAAFAPLKKAGVPVVTAGGAPIAMSTTNKTRAVIVQDPDGHFVELVQSGSGSRGDDISCEQHHRYSSAYHGR